MRTSRLFLEVQEDAMMSNLVEAACLGELCSEQSRVGLSERLGGPRSGSILARLTNRTRWE